MLTRRGLAAAGAPPPPPPSSPPRTTRKRRSGAGRGGGAGAPKGPAVLIDGMGIDGWSGQGGGAGDGSAMVGSSGACRTHAAPRHSPGWTLLLSAVVLAHIAAAPYTKAGAVVWLVCAACSRPRRRPPTPTPSANRAHPPRWRSRSGCRPPTTFSSTAPTWRRTTTCSSLALCRARSWVRSRGQEGGGFGGAGASGGAWESMFARRPDIIAPNQPMLQPRPRWPLRPLPPLPCCAPCAPPRRPARWRYG